MMKSQGRHVPGHRIIACGVSTTRVGSAEQAMQLSWPAIDSSFSFNLCQNDKGIYRKFAKWGAALLCLIHGVLALSLVVAPHRGKMDGFFLVHSLRVPSIANKN
eukprot:scaffold684_cov345-Pavlova_lutheri.AAC.63